MSEVYFCLACGATCSGSLCERCGSTKTYVPADTLAISLNNDLQRSLSRLSSETVLLAGETQPHEPDGDVTRDIPPRDENAFARHREAQAPEKGKLTILNEIGRGGMAAVLRGSDKVLGREVAIKVMHERYRERPDLVRRFIEEARICGQLQHFGIVPVYELGSFDDQGPYFTMKLIRGDTFAELLKARKDPAHDLPRMLSIFLHVCQTVAYAHARNVIHRDLKPLNIMVGAFGEVQVMDWGLAKVMAPRGPARAGDPASPGREEPALDSHAPEAILVSSEPHDASRAGTALGTPSYLSPEQANARSDLIDERTDVFALGSTLCEILTGRPCYTGASSLEILVLARYANLGSAMNRLASCGADADLIALARECLALDREHRPRDAGVLAERLTSYLADVQHRLRTAEMAKVEAQARAEEEQKRRLLADELVVQEKDRREMAVRLVEHERSRRRVTMGLAASILALLVVGVGSAAWYLEQRNRRIDSARDLIVTAMISIESADAAEDATDAAPDEERAKLAIEQAWKIADSSLIGQLKMAETRLRQTRNTRTLIARLEEIRSTIDGAEDRSNAEIDADYVQAFRDYGLDVDRAPAVDFANRLGGHLWSQEVADAAELWIDLRRRLRQEGQATNLEAVVQIVRAIDPSPSRERLIESSGSREGVPMELLRKHAADLEQSPRSTPSEYGRLAHLLAERGDRSTSLKVLLMGWDRFPEDYWLNHELGHEADHATHTQNGIKAFDADGLRFMTASVALRPQNGQAHTCLGRVLAERGRFHEAIIQYELSLQLRPQSLSTLRELGAAHLNKGDLERAEATFKTAVASAPHDIALRLGLASTLKKRGRTAEALELVEATQKLDPNRPEILAAHGEILVTLGQVDLGLRELEQAARAKPDDALIQRILAYELVKLSRNEEALKYQLAASKREPSRAETFADLASIHRSLGQDDESEEAVNRALCLDPNSTRARSVRVSNLQARGKLDEAVAECRKLVDQDPDNEAFNANLAMLLTSAGRDREAIEQNLRIIQLHDNYATRYNLGTALIRMRQYQGAVEHLRAAIKLKPDLGEAHCNLAMALRALGEYEQALVEMRAGHRIGTQSPAWPYPSSEWLASAERAVALAPVLRKAITGQVCPRDATLALELIALCDEQDFYLVVSHLYEDAFKLNPGLLDDSRGTHRIDAAGAAVLAGLGQSRDPATDSPTRAALRSRALGWLKAQLAFAIRCAGNGDPTPLAVMKNCQTSDRFTGVRDSKALVHLPAAERESWVKFWQELDKATATLKQPQRQ